jgi:hypothetical protein
MSNQEVGRWTCSKCGHLIVAAGARSGGFPGIGAFSGPCPWECGAWFNRGFRKIRTGQVKVFRAAEWDQRELFGMGAA